jgi:hypothetical protein
MSNQAQPKARKGTNPERNPAKANKGRSITPAKARKPRQGSLAWMRAKYKAHLASLCVLCGDTIKPAVGMDGIPIDAPSPMGCNPEPLATKGQCCHECDDWVLAARCGHSIATGLRFVRKMRQLRREAISEYLANKEGGAK